MSQNFQEMVGIEIGYNVSPIKSFGFFWNFVTAFDQKLLMQKSYFRLESGTIFAINRLFNAKVGANFSNIRIKDADFNYSPGLGLQAGLGFQLTSKFGMDLNYLVMNQTARRDEEVLFAQESGIEFAVHASF